MLLKNNCLCAVDIGSSKLAGALALFNKNHRITKIYLDTVVSKGVSAGGIADFADFSLALEDLLKNLQKKSGIKIKEFSVNVPGRQVSARHSRAIIPLAERGNKVITDSDVRHVNAQARTLGSSLEDEIIHDIAFGYIVDNDNFCSDPRELYGHRLEVDLYLLCAKLSYIQSISRCAQKLGYDIDKIVYSGLTSAKIALKDEHKSGLEVFCDIGADNTDLTFFKAGILHKIEVIPVGGNIITEALSGSFNISFNLAQELKISQAVIGNTDAIREDKEAMVKIDNRYLPLKQRQISAIATEKAESICSSIKDVLLSSPTKERIEEVVIAGRTVTQEGFAEKMEETIGLPVRLARIRNYFFMEKDIQNELSSSCTQGQTYLNALGILAYSLASAQEGISLKKQPSLKSFSGAINKVKQIYQQYF